MTDLSLFMGRQKPSITITGDNGIEVFITDLSDQGNPIQFEPVETFGGQSDINGEPFFWACKRPIQFSITVLPGTKSSVSLMNYIAAMYEKDKFKDAAIDTMTFKYASGSTVSFMCGRMTAGVCGVGVNGEGRMESQTFRFMFTKCSVESKNGRQNAFGNATAG